MEVRKLFWALGLLIRKPFYKHVGKLSYQGRPTALVGAKNISFGNRVRVYPLSRMETYGSGEIVIEDDCSIGQNFHITSMTSALRIGKSTTILPNVFVTNIDHEYQDINTHILRQPMVYRETEIGENCFICFGAAIQAGTILGRHCVVGANSVVRGVFPDYSVIVGAPARVVKRYNATTEEWERVDEKHISNHTDVQ